MLNSQTSFLFSIITVCYNSEKTIEKTIKSINEQIDYSNLCEHIFIDGLSADNTVNIIKRMAKENCVLVSEKDGGIYDAMNKGIKIAKGEWLCFMNSDDSFASNDILVSIKQIFEEQPDVELIYGKANIVRNDDSVSGVGQTEIIENKYWYPAICHQAAFFRKDLFIRYGLYELNRGVVADFIWFVKYFNSPHGKGLFIDKIIANFLAGGASSDALNCNKIKLEFAKEFFPLKIQLRYYIKFLRAYIAFKILRFDKDTFIRRTYRYFKRKLLCRGDFNVQLHLRELI